MLRPRHVRDVELELTSPSGSSPARPSAQPELALESSSSSA